MTKLEAVQTVGVWGAILLCCSILLLMVKEIVKIVFTGLTTW